MAVASHLDLTRYLSMSARLLLYHYMQAVAPAQATPAAIKSASLTLKSVTSSSGYVFPPIYSFPAFFT